jgi:signal transduction histidine kinase
MDAVQAESRALQSEALARIGSLAANVAHEIRNPLTAISATLQVIGASLDASDRRKPILTKVQEQVLRLDRLVSDLLGYARPVEPQSRRVGLGSVVREALAQAGVPARLLEAESVEVVADPQLVQQIIVNLLQNARDAAGGEGQIEVRVGPGPAIEIADDGPGVSVEVTAKLFEPFVTTKMRGTGLGLAISRKLAESMGGALAWDPRRGQGCAPGRGPGALFRLTLPPSPPRGGASPGDTAAHSG